MNRLDALRQKLVHQTKEELIEQVISTEQKRLATRDMLLSGALLGSKGLARLILRPRLYASTKTLLFAWHKWLGSKAEERGPWPKDESFDFIAALTNRLLLVGFIGLIALILPLVVMLIQTVIFANQSETLAQQSKLMERQISIQVFSQTSEFKSLLYRPPIDSIVVDLQDSNGDIVATKIPQWPPPDRTTIARIVSLAKSQETSVVDALRALLVDQSGTVAGGALLALAEIFREQGRELDASGSNLRGVNLTDVYFEWEYDAVPVYPWGAESKHPLNLHGVTLNHSDLVGARLAMADMSKCSFIGANLSRADLGWSQLQSVTFDSAILFGTRLTRSDMGHSHFHDADMTQAYIDSADFSSAILSYADLTGADFRSSHLVYTEMVGCEGVKYEQIMQATTKHISRPVDFIDSLRNSRGDQSEHKD